MPKRAEPLSPSTVVNAKPRAAPYKLADGYGLHLLVRPDGGKLWRWRYRRPVTGTENMLALGAYPKISLTKAREERRRAAELLAAGIDPGEQRKAEKAAGKERVANSFAAIADEWMATKLRGKAPATVEKARHTFDALVFPWIGARPITAIEAPDVLALARRIESRGAIETAHRTVWRCGEVFRYAIATGRASRDPTADLRGALTPVKVEHRAAITEPVKIGELLRAIDGYTGGFVVACALKLAPLVFVRPGELRKAEWSEIDLDGAVWRIPAARMKMGEAHAVPLAPQAVAILRELQPLTGTGRYVFTGGRDPRAPMSEAAINAALRRMGFDKATMTGHGFRALASSRLNELGWPPDVIERQLAHAERNKVRAAYNRAQYMDERTRMMAAWADYLDGLRAGGNVLPFERKAS